MSITSPPPQTYRRHDGTLMTGRGPERHPFGFRAAPPQSPASHSGELGERRPKRPASAGPPATLIEAQQRARDYGFAVNRLRLAVSNVSLLGVDGTTSSAGTAAAAAPPPTRPASATTAASSVGSPRSRDLQSVLQVVSEAHTAAQRDVEALRSKKWEAAHIEQVTKEALTLQRSEARLQQHDKARQSARLQQREEMEYKAQQSRERTEHAWQFVAQELTQKQAEVEEECRRVKSRIQAIEEDRVETQRKRQAASLAKEHHAAMLLERRAQQLAEQQAKLDAQLEEHRKTAAAHAEQRRQALEEHRQETERKRTRFKANGNLVRVRAVRASEIANAIHGTGASTTADDTKQTGAIQGSSSFSGGGAPMTPTLSTPHGGFVLVTESLDFEARTKEIEARQRRRQEQAERAKEQREYELEQQRLRLEEQAAQRKLRQEALYATKVAKLSGRLALVDSRMEHAVSVHSDLAERWRKVNLQKARTIAEHQSRSRHLVAEKEERVRQKDKDKWTHVADTIVRDLLADERIVEAVASRRQFSAEEQQQPQDQQPVAKEQQAKAVAGSKH